VVKTVLRIWGTGRSKKGGQAREATLRRKTNKSFKERMTGRGLEKGGWGKFGRLETTGLFRKRAKKKPERNGRSIQKKEVGATFSSNGGR